MKSAQLRVLGYHKITKSAQFRLKSRKVLSSFAQNKPFFKKKITNYGTQLGSFPKQQIKVRRPTGLFNSKVQKSIPRK